MAYTIEIDCAPGNPRPDTYLPTVLEGTGIEPEKLTLVGQFFGNWTWEVPKELEAQYEEARPTVENRISDLYYQGAIRYGSW